MRLPQFQRPRIQRPTYDGAVTFLAYALPAIILLPACILAAIPIFSLPLGSHRLYFFSWIYPAEVVSPIRGFAFGAWGTCRLATVNSLRACTSVIYGYGLDLSNLGLGTGQVISGTLCKALVIVLIFTAVFCLLALTLHTVAAIQHHRNPAAAKPSIGKAALAFQIITLPCGIASAVLAFKAYGPGVANINNSTGVNIASLGPCTYMVLASPILVSGSLVANAWCIWHAKRAAERTARRSGGAGKWNRFDHRDEQTDYYGADRPYRLDVKSPVTSQNRY